MIKYYWCKERLRGSIISLYPATDIFAVVSEVEGEGYKLSVYSDDTVPPFGPSLPCPPVFSDPQLFREFLLVSSLQTYMSNLSSYKIRPGDNLAWLS